ncbi:LOW QUALITY PROTEIN: membrane-spanning 4-domains subfamily A member 10-like [Pipistrellus kuhlii]|uniref:LOW QUALITY PROTEIN: membrane-spanning 4-domains subfamily A member 10-like n=1 Tax=Pipistrellus kuhlii TaxID=59472 RepID=UPI00174ED9D3|nr:LOW QUALITY PROTEIN: membrane-spanning 4-domains subfamily A member 10-like [Pipistrellus kuhlii]
MVISFSVSSLSPSEPSVPRSLLKALKPSHLPDKLEESTKRTQGQPCGATEVIVPEGRPSQNLGAILEVTPINWKYSFSPDIGSHGSRSPPSWPAQPKPKGHRALPTGSALERGGGGGGGGGRGGILLTLGASHIAIGVLRAVLGGYLAFSVKNLHLVTLKSWYPFWGPASFLFSEILAMAVAEVLKTSLKALCLIANLLSFLCGLASLLVLSKDLFLEKTNPWAPIWRPYPNSTVHIQRLQQVLFSLTWLELLLPVVTAVFSAADDESAESDDLPPVPPPWSW